MLSQMSLVQMAEEINRQESSKRDFIMDTRDCRVDLTSDDTKSFVNVGGGVDQQFMLNSFTHDQIATRMGVPKNYYQRLLDDHPDLLEAQINELMVREPKKRMIRTLDGTARAFLSSRYRRIDNAPLAETVLPALMDAGIDMEYSAFSMTNERMTMKLVFQQFQEIERVGQIVKGGLLFRNSEVGQGRCEIRPLAFTVVCTNGMVIPDRTVKGLSRTHLGSDLMSDSMAASMLETETMDAIGTAFFLQVRDMAIAMSSPKHMALFAEQLRSAGQDKIEGDVVAGVEELGKALRLTQQDQSGILEHLIRGGDLTRYGMANAVTRFAQDVSDYDRSTELEDMGGRVIDLPQSAWRRVATATA